MNRSVWTGKPYEPSCVANQRAAFVAPAVPGMRLGKSRENSVAIAAAAVASNAGGRFGGWSAGGRATLNASTSSGSPTSSQVPR